MAVIKFRIGKLVGPHRTVQVFDGPDADHLALCGDLKMSAAGVVVLARAVALAAPKLRKNLIFETGD